MKSVSERIREENQNTYSMFNHFLPKIEPFMR